MGESVLAIVGLGEAALPILKKAKEMGIKTVGFGLENSLGKAQADVFVLKSIFDVDGMYEACVEQKVSGVIASSEITTESAAILANRLGLPGNSIKGGFSARNKYLMRQRVAKLRTVRQPEFHLYEDGLKECFPVVVKSVDSCGKKGISLANDERELSAAVREAQKYSSDGSVLIEEYLAEGQEYSVECLSSGEFCTVVQVTEKNSSGPPHFIETGHHQPANISKEMKSRIEEAAKDILHVLGIVCGMAHLEIKICGDEIYFIEVGARAGGGHIGDMLVTLSTDCDYYKAAIECCFGTYLPKRVQNKAYSGIYHHLKQNEGLQELFRLSKQADWTVRNTVKDDDFPDVGFNEDRVKAGYFIYCSDHKIGMRDVVKAKNFHPVKINDHPRAFEMLWNHNREIGRNLTDEELKAGINKFLRQGNVIAILDGEHIIGFLNLYCNDYKTLCAYINNVYVLEAYRGCGLSKQLMEKAVSICKRNSFKKITLHVAENNGTAISLYKKFNFEFTGKSKATDKKSLEMALVL